MKQFLESAMKTRHRQEGGIFETGKAIKQSVLLHHRKPAFSYQMPLR